ncbi:hypothetical protein RGQ29_004165 [Quercus rubra]|uniref:Complex I assembly factor TIMMDC1, mitochondrial n=1 Tax=Quercus rubra TaxID=3512 RepID=A0AAN7I8J5_QUERU|nr:hypothetical protein RGQ29_004165 [Quercus rubra]
MEAPEKSEETVSNYTPRMAGTVNWGTATVVGVFAGLLYGGSREASASVSKDAEVMLKLGSTADKREQHRLMRDAMEKRFVRVARGSLIGGVRLGMFTAAFYSLQNLLAEKRGVHDVLNVVAAGSATASTFGLIMPGSLQWRARNVALGSVLGAAICFPLVTVSSPFSISALTSSTFAFSGSLNLLENLPLLRFTRCHVSLFSSCS